MVRTKVVANTFFEIGYKFKFGASPTNIIAVERFLLYIENEKANLKLQSEFK